MKKEDLLTKLTVIIPYYKTYNETADLLKNLEKQEFILMVQYVH